MTSNDCPKCGGPMVPLASQFVKICNDCKLELDWPLDDKQPPLISNSRDKRKRK